MTRAPDARRAGSDLAALAAHGALCRSCHVSPLVGHGWQRVLPGLPAALSLRARVSLRRLRSAALSALRRPRFRRGRRAPLPRLRRAAAFAVTGGELAMAARAMWKGELVIGKQRLPVKLYAGVQEKKVRFNLLHDKDEARVEQRLIDPETDEAVASAELRKGYEVEPGTFVVLEDEEIAELGPEG